MAARTRAQVEADMAALQAELDTADTDDEVWIKDESGREIKVTGRRATTVLSRFGDLFQEAAPEEGGAEGEGEEADPKPAGGYFGRKK
jgi:hypothetical protein